MSFAVSSVAMMGIGAISSAQASKNAAKTSQMNLQFQADIGEINARIAERGAKSALLTGEKQTQSTRLRTAQLKSSQRVALAANGVALDSDTAQNILNTTDVMGEIDALTVETNALQAAWGYRTQGQNYRNEAGMARANAAGISPSAAFNTSLISSAGSVASQWYLMNRTTTTTTAKVG